MARYGYTAITLCLACLLLLMQAPGDLIVDAVDVDIDFPDIDGLITYDQTWSGTKDFGQVTIQAGVNVTISPGAMLENYNYLSYIIVEGNLSAVGDEDLPIRIGKEGAGWDRLHSIDNGTLHMENCTVRSADYNVQPHGAPTYLKNVTTYGGGRGFDIKGDGHQVIDCTSIDPIYFGFYVSDVKNGLDLIRSNATGGIRGINIEDSNHVNITGAHVRDPTSNGIHLVSSRYAHIDGCTIENGGNYAVSLTLGSDLCTIENSRLNGTLGGLYVSVDGLTIRNCDLTFSNEDEGEWGMQLTGTVKDLVVEECVIDNCRHAITCSTDRWSDATFRRTSLGPDVHNILIRSSLTKGMSEEEIDVTFEHCDLNANGSIVKGLNPDSHVWMVNSTWNRGLSEPFNLSGGEVYISWFMDFGAKDGNGDLTPFNLYAEADNGNELIDVDAPSGYIEDLEVPIAHYNDTEQRVVIYDLEISSLIDPEAKMTGYGPVPYPETILWLQWDLQPTNNLPETVTIDEDEEVTWDLSEYLDDPEGQPLIYEVHVDGNMFYELDGTMLTFGGEENYYGDGWIWIGGTDVGGNLTRENITVTILRVNDAPSLLIDLPELVTPEDTSVWINLSEYGEDIDGDTIFWNSSSVAHAALSWDADRVNLTVIPEADWNGLLEIEMNLTDGISWINPVLLVNVTPVNDAPNGVPQYRDGTAVSSSVEDVGGHMVEVYTFEVDEDSSVQFTINASDIDGDDLLYLVEEGVDGVDLGTLNVETYTYLNETNVTVTGTVPYNFTYVPDPDANGEDILVIQVHDGLVNDTVYIKFMIIPVNDPPVLNLPPNLTVNVDAGVMTTIDLTEYISDVDGLSDLTLTVSGTEHATVDGLSLVLDYPGDYTLSGETLTLTLTDGEFTVTGDLLVAVIADSIPDHYLTDIKIKAEQDGWTVTAEGGEGQDVYLVIQDGEEKRSFRMEWDGKRYTVTIDVDDAEEGMQWYVTDTEDGDNPEPGVITSLPRLAEKEEDGSLTVVIVILLLIMIAFIIAIAAVALKGKGRGQQQDWGEE